MKASQKKKALRSLKKLVKLFQKLLIFLIQIKSNLRFLALGKISKPLYKRERIYSNVTSHQ